MSTEHRLEDLEKKLSQLENTIVALSAFVEANSVEQKKLQNWFSDLEKTVNKL